MNFAILRKLRALPGTSIEELISAVKQYVSHTRLEGMVEFAFYLSADDPQEMYVTSFWWHLQELNSGKEVAYHALLPILEGRGMFLEGQIYQLVWDFRRLSKNGQASVLRLLTLPDNYVPDWINKNIPLTRQDVSNKSDVQAVWIGRSMTNPNQIFYRTDWNSLQAQQSYFSSHLIQNSIASYKTAGIHINYASFELRGILPGLE